MNKKISINHDIEIQICERCGQTFPDLDKIKEEFEKIVEQQKAAQTIPGWTFADNNTYTYTQDNSGQLLIKNGDSPYGLRIDENGMQIGDLTAGKYYTSQPSKPSRVYGEGTYGASHKALESCNICKAQICASCRDILNFRKVVFDRSNPFDSNTYWHTPQSRGIFVCLDCKECGEDFESEMEYLATQLEEKQMELLKEWKRIAKEKKKLRKELPNASPDSSNKQRKDRRSQDTQHRENNKEWFARLQDHISRGVSEEILSQARKWVAPSNREGIKTPERSWGRSKTWHDYVKEERRKIKYGGIG